VGEWLRENKRKGGRKESRKADRTNVKGRDFIF